MKKGESGRLELKKEKGKLLIEFKFDKCKSKMVSSRNGEQNGTSTHMAVKKMAHNMAAKAIGRT